MHKNKKSFGALRAKLFLHYDTCRYFWNCIGKTCWLVHIGETWVKQGGKIMYNSTNSTALACMCESGL